MRKNFGLKTVFLAITLVAVISAMAARKARTDRIWRTIEELGWQETDCTPTSPPSGLWAWTCEFVLGSDRWHKMNGVTTQIRAGGTAEELSYLADLPNLRVVELYEVTDLDGRIVQQLSKLDDLVVLHFVRCTIPANCLEVLQAAPSLVQIYFDQDTLSRSGIQQSDSGAFQPRASKLRSDRAVVFER